MASTDIETKTLVINKLDTAKLKELQTAGEIKNNEVYQKDEVLSYKNYINSEEDYIKSDIQISLFNCVNIVIF